MKEFLVHDGMSIFDLAIQLYGSIESVYKLISENDNIENINENQQAGKSVKYEETIDNVVSFFRERKIFVNTSDPKVVSGASYSDAYGDEYS